MVVLAPAAVAWAAWSAPAPGSGGAWLPDLRSFLGPGGAPTADVVAALGRLVVVALGAYLSACLAIGAVARMFGLCRLVRVTDAVSVPAVRRLLDATVTLSVMIGAVAGPAALPAAASTGPVGPSSREWVERSDPSAEPLPVFDDHAPAPEPVGPTPDHGASGSSPPATAEPHPPPPPPTTNAPTTTTPPPPPAPAVGPPEEAPGVGEALGSDQAHSGQAGAPGAPAAPGAPGPTPAPTDPSHHGGSGPAPVTHTVAPGDSFWRIAERALHGAWGRPPVASEIVPYWRQLIEANRDRLVRPGDIDLLRPGQVLDLPPAPAPPPTPPAARPPSAPP